MKEPQLKPIVKAIKYLTQPKPIGNSIMDENAQVENAPMLTVDGNNYPINALPGDVQELIAAYQGWEKELNTQKLEVFKTEAAMRAVSAEIQNRVRQMADAAATAKEEAAVAPADVPDVSPAEAE
jgi:hypothetical protein